MQLAPGRALVTWLATGRIAPAHWPVLSAMLDDAERARADRLRFARDRDAYIAAHALTRGTLAQLTGTLPARWRFATDRYGKPHIVQDAHGAAIRFSLTHTSGLAAVAFTLEHDIGCDAEGVGDIMPEVARAFTPAERTGLSELHGAAARQRFYELWTLKEAYLKAVGCGLDGGLDTARFGFDPLSIGFAEPAGDRVEDWQVALHRPTPAHILAVAIRHADAPVSGIEANAVDLDRLIATPDDR